MIRQNQILRLTPPFLLLPLLLHLSQPHLSNSNECDPCAASPTLTGFKIKPNTNCVEYVQCINGVNMGDFTCNGNTIFDESAQYCNWPETITCAEDVTCPPTRQPVGTATAAEDGGGGDPGGEVDNVGGDPSTNGSGGTGGEDISQALLEESDDCENPCPPSYTGFRTRPGTLCKKYVQCDNGQIAGELECFGDTLFNAEGQYCDFPGSVSCSLTECPEQRPSPTMKPSRSPFALDNEESNEESTNHANSTESATDGSFNITSPTATPGETDTIDIIIDVENESGDCPNLCPANYTGLQRKPGTLCKEYVQCSKGNVLSEFKCYGEAIFDAEKGYCDGGWNNPSTGGSTVACQPTPCPAPPPTISPTESPSVSLMPTVDVTISYNNTNNGTLINPDETVSQPSQPFVNVSITSPTVIVASPTTPSPTLTPLTQAPTTFAPITSDPTNMPTPVFSIFQFYVSERVDLLKEVVFKTQSGDLSEEYTMEDFIKSLDVVVYQLPPSKAFFVGQTIDKEEDDSLPIISGMEYGLVNLAAFLANAMAEGIRIDSCDEINEKASDDSGEFYALSNACGQFGRRYEEEDCEGAVESFHCPLDLSMEIAADGLEEGENEGIPPFMCKPKDGFVGFYDTVLKKVEETVFSNSYGRTDVEGCCWWGRGVLLTRGRCTIGRLDYYLGKRATVEGFFSRYPDINFCSTPNAICDDVARTLELRWVLGFFEWADRVQSYNDSGWNYMQELQKFYDGSMVGDEFIFQVINILTRGCHNGLCAENDIRFREKRRDNFRKIIFDIFNLPLTRRPTPSPTPLPTPAPIPLPTTTIGAVNPTIVLSDSTQKPTRKNNDKGIGGREKEAIIILEDNEAWVLKSSNQFQFIVTTALSLFYFS
mmetsp:Transcript_910/g.1752  ORF Transcript_910/g.1752 Transcript_910/m.1752 type:complete len:881 (-) Transcript_910:121-2763(-)